MTGAGQTLCVSRFDTRAKERAQVKEPAPAASTVTDVASGNTRAAPAPIRWWSTGSALAGGGAVSNPDDPNEREADQIADAVTSGAAGPSTAVGGNAATTHTQATAAPAPRIGGMSVGRLGAGRPLDPANQRCYEGHLDAPLGDVRIHTDSTAAASASGLGALAYTRGPDIVFGTNHFAPNTATGSKLLAHELAHVVQQQAAGSPPNNRIQRQVAPPDPGAQSKPVPANIGTFVLDPALGETTPPSMATHVRVRDPWALGPVLPADRFIVIERQVTSATPIKVYAIRLQDVFNNPAEASTTISSESVRVLPTMAAGDPAWTARGQFTVTGISSDLVFSDTPVPEAVGAGAVILAQTDGGAVLIDSGQQLADRSVAGPIGWEITRRMLLKMPVGAVDEAVLMPGAPDRHNLPMIATYYGITSIRATPEQYADPEVRKTIDAVQQAQTTYRQWLEKSVRDELAAKRAEWEATQPIATSIALRDQRWQRHVEQATAEALGRVLPTTLTYAEDAGGITQLPPDAAVPISAPPDQPGPVLDLPDTRWQPSNNEILIVTGGGQLTVVSSRGLLMRPAPPAPAAPSSVTVPGLRPTGPTGPTPVGARPAASWVAASATGKAGQAMARTGNGPGVLFDAGGAARFLPEAAIARMVTELGVTSFDTILVTHPHADHVRVVIDLITNNNIRAARFITSANWNQAGSRDLNKIIEALQRTTDQRLIDLGYGEKWRPGIAVGTEGVSRATLRVPGGQVEIYTRADAHAKIRDSIRQTGTVSGKVLDSSSLLYVVGNEASSHRVAVIGDLRGRDILALAAEMNQAGGPEAFGRAMTGVRVLVGFGHHMGLDAGSTEADVRGYELLFKETLLRNGKLTIVVQSTQEFAFGTDPARAAQGRALLEFATSMGARVVFAGEPTSPTAGGGAVVSSDLSVRTYGTGVTIHEGDARVGEAVERLQMLREARRTVAATRRPAPTSFGEPSPTGQAEMAEIGPQQLRLSGSAAEIQTRLEAEILRMQTLLEDLLGRRSADLLDVRGEDVAATTKAEFRAQKTRSGLTVEQIHEQLAQKGPVESALQPEIVNGLRAAVRQGSTLAIEAELLATPRGVSEAVQRLPEAQRAALEEHYRELAEAAKKFTGNEVPAERRVEILHKVEELRAALRQLATEVPADMRGPVDVEVQRLTGVIDELMKGVESQTVTGRDAEGRLTNTEYRMAKPPDRIDKAFARVGQVMGAVMVVHSVQGMAQTAAGVQAGQVNVPEAVFKFGHAAHSFSIGVRMVQLRPVSPVEFVALALLEFGSIVSTDFKTSEERDFALATTGVNQACMALGMAVMHGGAYVPHPVGKAVVMGLGLAITMAGPPLLRLLGLDEWLVRKTSFPPGAVTHVYQEIEGVLTEYEAILGAEALAGRSDTELTALGATDPVIMRKQAAEAKTQHIRTAHEKEQELVSLFKEAYEVAAESFAGLRNLDTLAARFSRLRHAAMPGEAAKAGLEQRFLEMDPQAGLFGNADRQTIRNLHQWRRLQSKLYSLYWALVDEPVKWPKIFEEMDEAHQMIDNARYRVDSAASGNRPVPMIAPGTPAYAEYVDILANYESWYLGMLQKAAAKSGSGGVYAGYPTSRAPGQPGGGDPLRALNFVQSMRTAYDTRVVEAAAELPELAKPETWADSFLLGKRLEQAHRLRPDLFNRLHLAEMTLSGAIGQARTAAATAVQRDPALTALIEREAQSAEKAMEARRQVRGLVFPNEIDADLATRRTAEDRTLGAKIDAAYPRRRLTSSTGPEPVPLSEEEIRALRTDELKSPGRKMTSTEHQLRKAWELLGPVREVDWNQPFSYAAASRVDRQLVRFRSDTFWIWDTEGWDSSEKHSVPAGRDPIMAKVGGEELGNTTFFSGPTRYERVLAINADAVAVLGPEPVLVAFKDMAGVSLEELAARAAAGGYVGGQR